MANVKKKRNENQDGNFFVDETCIDCGTCYWMSPQNFRWEKGKSAVFNQPQSVEEIRTSLQALLSCPTHSIGTIQRHPLLPQILQEFPLDLEDATGIYHCGFHAESSFGAASYFIRHSEGNILVDSPRFVPHLVQRFESMGGIKFQFLTHQDDIADTDLYHAHFGTERIIHCGDLTPQTRHYEKIIEGDDPLPLNQENLLIPVPGHTKGHTLLLQRSRFLFTGDHLAYSPERGHLYAFRKACWYDWKEQISSMEKLLNFSFSWVLPGHGAPFKSNDPISMQEQIKKCLHWMKDQI